MTFHRDSINKRVRYELTEAKDAGWFIDVYVDDKILFTKYSKNVVYLKRIRDDLERILFIKSNDKSKKQK